MKSQTQQMYITDNRPNQPRKTLTIFILPPHSRQTQTDRQTDKIQLTNTTHTKLKPKVTKCQIIHAVHFATVPNQVANNQVLTVKFL